MGVRLGACLPKALVAVGGRPLVWHAAAAALQCASTAHLVVVAPAAHRPAVAQAVTPLGQEAGVPVEVVPGGAERGDSVRAGIGALPRDLGTVLVHDAARAFAPAVLFAAVAATVQAGHPAVVPGEPVVDTVKSVDGAGHVTATLDRSILRTIQTPQGFQRELLHRAHDERTRRPSSAGDATDDAGLVERLGVPVLVVDGHPDAFKVTSPADLQRAERLVAARSGTMTG